MTRRPGLLRLAILGDLLRHPNSSITEMLARVDLNNWQNTEVTLQRLRGDGLVAKVGVGRWTITDEGRTELDAIRHLIAEE